MISADDVKTQLTQSNTIIGIKNRFGCFLQIFMQNLI